MAIVVVLTVLDVPDVWSIVLPSPSPRGGSSLGQLVSVSEPEEVVGGGGGLALLTVAGLAGRLFCVPGFGGGP